MAELPIKEKAHAQQIIDFHRLTPRPQERDDEFSPIYSLPLNQIKIDELENKVRIFRYGYAMRYSDPLIIMLIGTGGTGKSTAINALINYLLGVQYEDNYRFELVNLERDIRDQNNTQTEWVTVYEINEWKNSPVKRPIFIVHTTGFHATYGKEKDEQTVRKIKLLFEKYLSTIHAVCVTLNGTESRLTESQKYIFDSINKIFGKDIVNNLYIWATFTDFDDPPVRTSLKHYNINYQKLFAMENGTLYRKKPEERRAVRKCKYKFEDVYEVFDQFFNTVQEHCSTLSV